MWRCKNFSITWRGNSFYRLLSEFHRILGDYRRLLTARHSSLYDLDILERVCVRIEPDFCSASNADTWPSEDVMPLRSASHRNPVVRATLTRINALSLASH